MTHHELTLKSITAGIAGITGTLSAMFSGGLLANATGDATLFGINLSTLEKITLVTALMLVAIVLGFVAHRLFTRFDAIQTARIEDAKAAAAEAHKVIQANTLALQQVASTQADLAEAVKELPRNLKP